ncbi:hypothetical protein RF11_00380 [Thelohanellus kitauei]|uniref:Uncharacterized protein n=1 Tax=Thelohanellus kitauei TaxID=669202 RepID=A0A0C2IZY6_THEKT|nr:hypothetical protein RF11_00380 [Thelohanellus kitauei]
MKNEFDCVEYISICSTIFDKNANEITNDFILASYQPSQPSMSFSHQTITVDEMIKNEISKVEKLKTISTEHFYYFIHKFDRKYCFIFVLKNFYSKFFESNNDELKSLKDRITQNTFERYVFKFLKVSEIKLKEFYYESIDRISNIFGADTSLIILARFLKHQFNRFHVTNLHFVDSFINIARPKNSSEYIKKIQQLFIDYKLSLPHPVSLFVTNGPLLLWSDLSQQQTKSFFISTRQYEPKLTDDVFLQNMTLEKSMSGMSIKSSCVSPPKFINSTIYLPENNEYQPHDVILFSIKSLKIYIIWRGYKLENTYLELFVPYLEKSFEIIERNIQFWFSLSKFDFGVNVNWIMLINKSQNHVRFIQTRDPKKISTDFIDLKCQDLINQDLLEFKRSENIIVQHYHRIFEQSWLLSSKVLDTSVFCYVDKASEKFVEIKKQMKSIMKTLLDNGVIGPGFYVLQA